MRLTPTRLMLGGFLVLVALVLGFQILEFTQFAFSPLRSGAPENLVVAVQKGQGPNEISKTLQNEGVISDAKLFLWLGRVTRQWKNLKAGEYQVSPAMSPLQVFRIITSGISVHYPITIREGENMFEVADDLAAKKLAPREKILALCRSREFMKQLGFEAPLPPSLEGYLFPDTYHLTRNLSPEEILKRMVRPFFKFWSESHSARAKQLGLNRHQVVTLASIVEKETGAPQERRMISSVFHNRLRKKMRLQSDPTTIYGIWDRYRGNIRKADLLTQNDYNTYMIPALPIGPISNPGREAIEAALHPVESEFFFFVSQNDGTHVFTRTFEEHVKAVQRYQVDPRARTGKSWRDLHNKNKQAGNQR